MDSINKKVLLCCTGSVATIKVIDIINNLKLIDNVDIKVVFTKCAFHFCNKESIKNIGVAVYEDIDEWDSWKQRGDPVLHIELGKWADLILVAPLDANTLAKVAQGICDNLVTCVIRAWDLNKTLIFCPAMNTRMWTHPVTSLHITQLKTWGFVEISCISKTLMCKDVGLGAMAEPETIVEIVKLYLMKL